MTPAPKQGVIFNVYIYATTLRFWDSFISPLLNMPTILQSCTLFFFAHELSASVDVALTILHFLFIFTSKIFVVLLIFLSGFVHLLVSVLNVRNKTMPCKRTRKNNSIDFFLCECKAIPHKKGIHPAITLQVLKPKTHHLPFSHDLALFAFIHAMNYPLRA